MKTQTFSILLSLVVAWSGFALPAHVSASEGTVIAQAQGTQDGQLKPRYEPTPPEDPGAYDNEYVFAMTRGVANAAIAPYGKVPLYVLSLPIDLALLPFAVIGGFFG